MTFVAAMTERNVFESLRAELVSRDLGFRPLFWLTGVLSFFLSAALDNLTTALIMSAVILAVGAGNVRFITLGFINLVVAANAGGAWSAFGDITTLMVWQAHKVEFFEFFALFLPSVVTWLVPATIMHFALPPGKPPAGRDDADVKYGGWFVCGLFALTIALTVTGKQLLHMPPVYGMLSGLALLKVQAWFIRRHEARGRAAQDARGEPEYNVFEIIARAEWDTLLFFYGVLLCVGGLGTLGYLELASSGLYGQLGPTGANISLGLLSAIVDNIPIMYAVLQMNPAMDHGQWLLITLTAGVGGSLLSVGSAAGVALMGVSQGALHFHGPPEMDLGDRPGLFRRHRHPPVGQRPPFHLIDPTETRRRHHDRTPPRPCPGADERLLRDVGDGGHHLAQGPPEGNGQGQPRRRQGPGAGRAPGELPVRGAGVDHPARPADRLARRRAPGRTAGSAAVGHRR